MILEKEKKLNTGAKISSGKFLLPQSDDREVTYPSSKNLRINHADLKLELLNFSEAVRSEINLGMGLATLSLWAAIITANFNDLMGFDGRDIRIVFFTVATILTLLIFKPILFLFLKCIVKIEYFRSRFEYLKKWDYRNETDPEKKADNIIEKALGNK